MSGATDAAVEDDAVLKNDIAFSVQVGARGVGEWSAVRYEQLYLAHREKNGLWPTGLMVKASVSGASSAEDSGFESQVGRFLLLSTSPQ